MFIHTQKVITATTFIFFLPILGMQQKSRLDLLPAEITAEIAKYYIYPLHEPNLIPINPESGIHLDDAIKKVRQFYELHLHCKTHNPEVTKVLLGHLIENFSVRSLDEFETILKNVERSKLMPIFSSLAIQEWVAQQQRKIAQVHELFSPNLYTAYFSSTKINTLIALGVDVNVRHSVNGKGGETPLIRACKAGNKLLVCSFLDAGADVTLQDYNGKTAIEHVPNLYLERFNAIRALLVEAGADRNQIPPLQDPF